jgi:16S rRNA (cytidine1402-2'-O)-methyltransferase
MTGTLYIVATPIGNLEDITQRALRILREVDMIACEDTRVTSHLLAYYEIRKPLVACFEHSSTAQVKRILDTLMSGSSVAYVSDAGTPGVNDPGGKLIEAAVNAHVPIQIVPIPGASALTTAIAVCGFPMDEFVYLGFVPHKKGRETMFREISTRATPSVFFESTHRIEKTLEALAKFLDPVRPLFIARELTKLHETLYRGTIEEVLTSLQSTSTKGEFVIIVGPTPKRVKDRE